MKLSHTAVCVKGMENKTQLKSKEEELNVSVSQEGKCFHANHKMMLIQLKLSILIAEERLEEWERGLVQREENLNASKVEHRRQNETWIDSIADREQQVINAERRLMDEKEQFMDEVSRMRTSSMALEDQSFSRDRQPSQFAMSMLPTIQESEEEESRPVVLPSSSWMGSISSLTTAVSSVTSNWASSLAGSIRSKLSNFNLTRPAQIAVAAAAANSFYYRGKINFGGWSNSL